MSDCPNNNIILAFQQGYVAGVLGANFNIPYNFKSCDMNDIDGVTRDKILSGYGNKISKFFDDDQRKEFEHAVDIGIHNSICALLYSDTAFKCSCRFYNKIIESKKHDKLKNLITTSGYKIGDIIFGKRECIPSLIIIKKGGCDICGFTKFCQCFSFTDYNQMLGAQNYHYGTHVCVDCGKFDTEIYYKTDYKCLECKSLTDISVGSADVENDKRDSYIKNNRYKQTYYKTKNITCLECSKSVDPYEGIWSCSNICTKKLLIN